MSIIPTKRIPLVTMGGLFAFYTSGQITLYVTDHYGPGQMDISYEAVPDDISEGPAGPGVTWDFSSAGASGQPDTTLYFDAAGTTFAADFPAANLTSQPSSGATGCSYMVRNADSTAVLGGAYYQQDSSFLVYADPIVLARFPVAYGGTFTDQFAYASGPFDLDNGDQFSRQTHGTVLHVVDAYGLLSTPLASMIPALRTKLTAHQVDTTVISGAQNTVTISHSNITQYTWTTAGPDRFGFTISYLSNWQEGSLDTLVLKSVRYSRCGLAATEVAELNGERKMRVSPNPTEGLFTIASADQRSMESMTIIDALGQVTLTAPLNGKQRQTIDLSPYESGVYFVEVQHTDGSRAVERVVKQ